MSLDIYPDKATIAIILGVFVPGAGHIYWSQLKEWNQLKKGITIAVSAVIVGIVSAFLAGIVAAILTIFIPFTPTSSWLINGVFASVLALGPAIIWIWQIKNLLKILNVRMDKKMKPGKTF